MKNCLDWVHYVVVPLGIIAFIPAVFFISVMFCNPKSIEPDVWVCPKDGLYEIYGGPDGISVKLIKPEIIIKILCMHGNEAVQFLSEDDIGLLSPHCFYYEVSYDRVE